MQLAGIFTNHMVLQRHQNIRIWGTTDGEKIITVIFRNKSYKATIEGDRWSVLLNPHEAGGPYELVVEGESEGVLGKGITEIKLLDIMVGEVWIAGGQSNMGYILGDDWEWGCESEESDISEIRFYSVPKRPFVDARVVGWHAEKTFSEDTIWEACEKSVVKGKSAIAYYFAKKLNHVLHVPIGIIECNWGGTGAECWVSESVLLENKSLSYYLSDYRKIEDDLNVLEYEKEFLEYLNQLEEFAERKGDTQKTIRESGLYAYANIINRGDMPMPPMGYKSFQRPCGLYRAMVEPIAPYTVNGVIWYQGENNANARGMNSYQKLMECVIKNWRDIFCNQNLHFSMVQLSSYACEDLEEEKLACWAYIREAQRRIANQDKNVSLVVSADYGEKHNIHPVLKRPIGYRLAETVLHKMHGAEEKYRVIEPIQVKQEHNVIKVLFKENLKFAYCKCEFTIFYLDETPTKVQICELKQLVEGCEICIPCFSEKRPYQIAYCLDNYITLGLYDKDENPVTPFIIEVL